jgi:hypothetical protein
MRAILAILMLVLPGTALAQAADPDATFVLAAEAGADTMTIDATIPLSLSPALSETLDSQEPALFAGAAVAETVLADTNGRAQVNWLQAISENTAVVANNVTGAVNVADNAFQNVSGIAMVNFNTGNNSSINAGMSVNLQINYAQPGQ